MRSRQPSPGCLGDHPRDAVRVFPAASAAIRDVRVWLRTQLAIVDLAADVVDTAELLISEVATNALTHTRASRIIVRLVTDHVLEASVRDPATRLLPQVEHPRPEDAYGRGLQLVEALATEWGTSEAHPSKWVWFRLGLELNQRAVPDAASSSAPPRVRVDDGHVSFAVR